VHQFLEVEENPASLSSLISVISNKVNETLAFAVRVASLVKSTSPGS